MLQQNLQLLQLRYVKVCKKVLQAVQVLLQVREPVPVQVLLQVQVPVPVLRERVQALLREQELPEPVLPVPEHELLSDEVQVQALPELQAWEQVREQVQVLLQALRVLLQVLLLRVYLLKDHRLPLISL